jgi:hypothetical protein
MPEYGSSKLGQIYLPVPGTNFPAEQIMDPALYHTSLFIRALIELNLQEAWNRILTYPQVQAWATEKKITSNIVKEFILYDPAYFWQENQYNFPLAVLCRGEKEESRLHTVNHHVWEGVWKFQYILPPMTADIYYHIAPFFNGIKTTLSNFFQQGYHPDYMGGVKPLKDYLVQVGVQDSTVGVLEFTEGSRLHFPTLELGFYFCEIREPSNVLMPGEEGTPFSDLTGVDADIDLVNEDEEDLEDIADIKVDL